MSGSTDATSGVETTGAGRYLYCLVELDGGEDDDPREGTTATVDVAGIEGATVSTVAASQGSVGALVHPRAEPFDTTDLTALQDWLLAHQQVVEAAGDRFGTPLPVRFDTVLDGGDETVAAWLDRNIDQITDAFEEIAGCREYRVTVSWDSTAFEAEQRAADAKLAEIDRQLGGAGDGTQFLLEKQYEQRLRDLVRQRRAALTEELVDGLRADSRRVTERPVQSDAAESLGIELDTDAVAQVALLAPQDREQALGSWLDGFTDTPGVEVRFTGPWPPYTFAPQLTDDG